MVKEIEIWRVCRIHSRIPWKECWSCFSRRLRVSDKIFWSAGGIGHKRMDNAKCWYCSLWNQTDRQLESQRMELYQENQLTDEAQREKSWPCEELDIRNKASEEDRARDYQDIEELRRICCAEADRARRLKYDELSTQQKENPSTVNQLMVQIQELQDKVNSLNDAKEFCDPDCEQLWIIPRSQSKPWVFRDPEVCLAAILACSVIHGTHWVHQETFLRAYLLEKDHLQLSSRIQRIWQRLLADKNQLIQTKLRNKEKDWEKNRRIIQYQLFALPGSFRPGILEIVQEELSLKIVWWKIRGIRSRTYISINSLTPQTSTAGRPISRLKYALTQDVLRSQCYGSKK